MNGSNLQFFLARAEQARSEAEAARRAPLRARGRRAAAAGPARAARADRPGREGAAATLPQGGVGCRRSEAAWQALADRAERSERMRELEALRKAEAGLTS